MGILDKFKSKAVAARQLEERLYTKVEQEMATGRRNEALWLMALEQAEYDTEKQLASYITLRVQALQDVACREGGFDNFKTKAVATRKSEEKLYERVAEEMNGGHQNRGLWLKALEQAGGNTDKQPFKYIRLRVQALRDEEHTLGQLEREISKKTLTLSSDTSDADTLTDSIRDDVSVVELKNLFSGYSERQLKMLVNKKDASEDLPLHAALKKYRINVAQWLLSLGADPELKNYWGKTAREIAVREMVDGSQDMVLWLKALDQVHGNTNEQLARYLMLRSQSAQKMPINCDFNADSFVAKIKDEVPLEKLRILLKGYSLRELKNAIDKPDASGELPLHLALKKDRMDVAEWLLALGANTDARNYWGKTAKEIARLKDSGETLKLVLRYASLS
jgi:hypothetical protein